VSIWTAAAVALLHCVAGQLNCSNVLAQKLLLVHLLVAAASCFGAETHAVDTILAYRQWCLLAVTVFV
jgi:hypothetical protein